MAIVKAGERQIARLSFIVRPKIVVLEEAVWLEQQRREEGAPRGRFLRSSCCEHALGRLHAANTVLASCTDLGKNYPFTELF